MSDVNNHERQDFKVSETPNPTQNKFQKKKILQAIYLLINLKYD